MFFLLLYNLLFAPAFLLLLPGYLARMFRRGGWRQGFGQRFGFYPAELRARLATEAAANRGSSRLWIQAVSVGEVLVALKLVAALRQRAPDLRLLLSTTTTTGYALARERVAAAGWNDAVEALYTPLDFLPCAALAWRSLRPAGVVVVEGGLWPNQVALATRAGRPVALVNARLSPRSERRFRRFRAVTGPLLFAPLKLLAAPDQGDRERWHSLGARGESITISGSLKLDDETAISADTAAADASRIERLRVELSERGLRLDPARPVLLAGSTHAGEEALVAAQFLRLRSGQFSDLLLVIAPRHVERSAEVRAQLAGLGLSVVSRRELAAKPPAEIAAADVLLLDTTGELRDWFALATVVFVGKSLALAVSGGQNPVEPLLAGRPPVFGPRMENFAEIVAALLLAGGAVQVPDAAGLHDACARLLADAERRARIVTNGRAVLATHRGAAARTAEALLPLFAFPAQGE